ncbi:class II aldolase/adducin family protein [Ramlibacter sp.]|uniref:class II aldolase/adducin family protein n=1 Tax=Ramlibacter sp. TaxID=1917967 RepID=UPI003D09C56B
MHTAARFFHRPAGTAPLAESDPRFRVAAARRMLARAGCESGIGGHVSMRAEDGASFWTTPLEYFDETTPASVMRFDLDGRLLSGDHDVSPAVEFHCALYRARPDVGCVIHLHSHFASVVAATGEPIGMYNVGSVVLFDEQAFLADDGTRPPVEGHRVIEALGTRSVLMVKNHGAIVVGPDLEHTTGLAMLLEASARYHVEVRAAGGSEIPLAEVRRGQGSYRRIVVPRLWTSHYRRLARTDADLFTWVEP